MLRLRSAKYRQIQGGAKPVEVLVEFEDTARTKEGMIASYLDEIVERLDGVPFHRRTEIRQELHTHLESMIASYSDLDTPADEAARRAMAKFGSPQTIARRFRRAWVSTAGSPSPWGTMCFALGIFGCGAIACGTGTALAGPVNSGAESPGTVPATVLGGIMSWLFPIVAGAWIGSRNRGRAGIGVFYACLILAALFAPMAAVSLSMPWMHSPIVTPALAVMPNLWRCLATWPILGAFSAALVKQFLLPRAKVESATAFALRCFALSFANYWVSNLFLLDVFTVSVFPHFRIASHGLSLFGPISVAWHVIVPAWTGWRIGQMWPSTEAWRRPLVYLAVGAALGTIGQLSADCSGSLATRFLPYVSHPWATAPIMSTISRQLAGAPVWFLTFVLPISAIALALRTALARGRETQRIGAAAVTALLCVEIYPGIEFWAWKSYPAAESITVGVRFLVLPAAMAAIAWMVRGRLPRWIKPRVC